MVKPLLTSSQETLAACQFKPMLLKLTTLLSSIEIYLKTAVHLSSGEFDGGLDLITAEFSTQLDNLISQLKILEEQRVELLREEEAFRNTRQRSYVGCPPLEDAHDDRALLLQDGFGDMYRMTNTVNGGNYAVKRLRVALLPGKEVSIAALAQECKTLQALSHTHIARNITMFLSKEGRFFNIVTELVEGGTLAEKLTCTPAPTKGEIVEWMRQMASALSYMHNAGVLHRDLKPENAILTRIGEIKLVGLKLVCLASSADALSPYTSFEKATGGPYDGRDDVWAAGGILYELLTRERYDSCLLLFQSATDSMRY
jgi:hypothetical protein